MKVAHIVALAALGVVAQSAAAVTVTVDSKSDIYRGAGDDGSDGITPVIINLGTATSITFSVTVNGPFTVNHGTGDTPNDADGIGNPNAETNTGFGLFSGIKAPNAGFLAGVFVSGNTPLNAPPALDFTGAGGTSFTSITPLLDQVFFIGDGLTGDGTGTTQVFNFPAAGGRARQLVLGLTDACSYSGAPSCYSDNLGSFTVNYTLNGGTVATAPEPATWATMVLGFGAVGGALRRRQRRAALSA